MSLNNKWYTSLNKSPLTPPSWVFGLVWPILYVLMFISTVRVLRSDKCIQNSIWNGPCKIVYFFLIHLIFNFSWTYLFFTLKRPDLALIDLTIMILFVITITIGYMKYDLLAGILFLPYLLWSLFALYLNSYIVLHIALNKEKTQ